MIKLIASDMDGTLLNSKHLICSENLEAIKFAQEKGVHFAISTGRDYISVKPVLDKYGINCECIVMNGSEYRDVDGQVIDSIAINKENIKTIIEVFHQANLSAELMTNDGLYASDKILFEKARNDRRKIFCAKMREEELKEFDKQFEESFNAKYIDDIDSFIKSDIQVFKAMTYNEDVKVIEAVKGRLKEVKELAIASTFSNDIEITNIDAQKGKMLAKVTDKMGIDRDEVMIIGDSFNDYSMFEEFNNSFAMGNAIPEIKEIANYITDTNDNAGVAKAIYKMINN